MLYFDHNATSPLCDAAREAWLEASARYIANPSSPHRLGARADRALQEARAELAAFLGCSSHDIVWTSGATEAANMVLAHYSSSGGEAWISAIEHPCILETARRRFKDRLTIVPVTSAGIVDLEWLREALARRRPALLAVMAANNETGILQPWREVSSLCDEFAVPFVCDASQWVGKLPATGLGSCSFVIGSAHKFGGPLGVGFLKMSGAVTPLLTGGPQEDDRRAGTENVPGILATVAALRLREGKMASGELTLRFSRRAQFVRELLAALPGSQIVSGDSPSLWNTVSAILPEVDCRTRWVVKLDKLGAAVSTGSACASGKEKPSHVLSAMGFAASQASRALRFSAGWETAPEEWYKLVSLLSLAAKEILSPALH